MKKSYNERSALYRAFFKAPKIKNQGSVMPPGYNDPYMQSSSGQQYQPPVQYPPVYQQPAQGFPPNQAPQPVAYQQPGAYQQPVQSFPQDAYQQPPIYPPSVEYSPPPEYSPSGHDMNAVLPVQTDDITHSEYTVIDDGSDMNAEIVAENDPPVSGDDQQGIIPAGASFDEDATVSLYNKDTEQQTVPQAAAAFCGNCGTKNENGSMFCSNCGNKMA